MWKKKPQTVRERKLNNAPASEEQNDWTLEEIMDEFGGWTKREPEKPPAPPETPPEPPQVEAPEPGQTAQPPQESPAEPSAPAAEEDVSVRQDPPEAKAKPKDAPLGDTIRFVPVQAEPPQESRPQIWSYKGEQPPGMEQADPRTERQQARRQRQLERIRKREQRKENRRREKPDHAFSSAQEARAYYAAPSTLKLRVAVSAALTLISVLLLILVSGVIPGVSLADWTGVVGAAQLLLMLVQAGLSYEVLIDGVRALLQLRFGGGSMLAVSVLVVAVDAVFAILHERVPFCAAMSLHLTVTLWSRRLLHLARLRSLKAVCESEQPVAAVRQEKAWREMDCIFRAEADVDRFAQQLELPDAGRRILRVYAPVMTALCLVLSVLAALRSDGSFLWSWAAMLCAAYPAGAAIAFTRPFARQAKIAGRAGNAVAGWFGARTLSGEVGLAIGDSDLFPAANVTLNGMKIYSSDPVARIVSYATAVVESAGSGLVPLFEEMRREQNGRQFHVDAFRRYEGGGLGAEIGGDVVLMGSHGFMRLMKVQMPEQAKVKQGVYLSVNGELAALFALTYAPASSVKSGLFAVVRSKGLIPVLATSDFMITPQFLKQRYKLPPDRVEFPTVEERARLAAYQIRPETKQGAVMAKDSFASFAGVVTGARSLRSAAVTALSVTFAGSVLGLLILFFLTFIGAIHAVTGWNLLVYAALWLLPNVLISAFFGAS